MCRDNVIWLSHLGLQAGRRRSFINGQTQRWRMVDVAEGWRGAQLELAVLQMNHTILNLSKHTKSVFLLVFVPFHNRVSLPRKNKNHSANRPVRKPRTPRIR